MTNFGTSSPRSFLARVAFLTHYNYVRHTPLKTIPPGKDPLTVEQKIALDYGITSRRATRSERKKQGLANVTCVRWDNILVILATPGTHPVFDRMKHWDLRGHPMVFLGHELKLRNDKPAIQIAPKQFIQLRADLLTRYTWERSYLERYLRSLPYCRFPIVVRQLDSLVRLINHRRRSAKLPEVRFNPRSRPLLPMPADNPTIANEGT